MVAWHRWQVLRIHPMTDVVTEEKPSAQQGAGAAVPESGSSRTIPLSACFGWGSGAVGMSTLLSSVNALILKFMVDTLGMTAAIAGSIVAATRLFDAGLDPFMGSVSDRTASRWGRRRPYLLVGSILCASSSLAIFAVPFWLPNVSSEAYITFALIFFAVAYTVFAVPHLTMAVEMTDLPRERTFLISFRIYGNAIGTIFGASLGPWIVARHGGGEAGYIAMAWALAGIILATCLGSFWLTRSARTTPRSQASHAPRLRQLRLALDNRPFMTLMMAKATYVIGTGVHAAAMAFFITTVLQQSLALLGIISVLTMISVIMSQPVWVVLAKRWGKRRCFLAAAPGHMMVSLSWLFASASDPTWAVLARAPLMGFVGGGMLLATQAMLPDTLQYEFERTGVRQEGTLAGVFTAVERGVTALGVALAGLILSAGGYVGGEATQTSSALAAIYICVAAMPAIGVAISIAFIARYELDH